MQKYELMSASKEDAKKWIMATYTMGVIDGILKTVYYKEKGKASQGVLDALMKTHVALKNVDKCFCDVANAINRGEDIPGIELPPIDLDDWDTEGTTTDGIIDMLTNTVRMVLISIPPVSSVYVEMAIKALEGLLNAFDEYKREAGRSNTCQVNLL